jgi:hypothetical protein
MIEIKGEIQYNIMMNMKIIILMIIFLRTVKIRISLITKKVNGYQKINRMLILINKSMMILIDNINKKI